jgi:hypothetical protein
MHLLMSLSRACLGKLIFSHRIVAQNGRFLTGLHVHQTRRSAVGLPQQVDFQLLEIFCDSRCQVSAVPAPVSTSQYVRFKPDGRCILSAQTFARRRKRLDSNPNQKRFHRRHPAMNESSSIYWAGLRGVSI